MLWLWSWPWWGWNWLLGAGLAVWLWAGGLAGPGWADTIYVYKDKDGVMHFTDLPDSDAYQPYFSWPETEALGRERIKRIIHRYSRDYDVDPHLIQAVIQVESDYNPRARSSAGAEGLMQLMPETQQDLGVTQPFDAQANIRAGVLYLSRLLQRFPSTKLALAAYNAGPTRVMDYGGVPPFPETQRYVQAVLSLYQDLSARTRDHVQSGQ